jgi:hypothetical protein
MLYRIQFQGNEYVTTSPPGGKEGFIATRHQFKNGEVSFAHFYPDGKVRQFGQVIGTVEEVKWLGPTTVNPTASGIVNTLLGEGWPN